MVFIFDTFIGALSVLIANYLRFNLDFKVITSQFILDDLVLVILTNALFFYIFRTFQGIIRFSGFAEAVRTTSALFGSFIVLMFLNFLMNMLGRPSLIPPSVLIINLLSASFMMVGYRLMVKVLYRSSLSQGKNQHVVIYGGELNGSQLKYTIEQSSDYQYKVVGFIDDDLSYVGKSIDNVKIYSFDQIKDVMKTWDIKLLLFAKPDLDSDLKNKVVDFCLEHDIQVRNIPPVGQWIKGHLSISELKEIKIEELLGRPQIKIRNQMVTDLVGSKRVLITGAAGSIGGELARQIATLNPSLLIVCDQNETGLYELEYELKNNFPVCQNVSLYIGDVRDESSMESLFKRFRPQVVFHAAAYKHVPMMEYHPSEAIRNNVLGTRVLANLSIEYGVERFLLISTDKAINPTNVMGASKRIAEIYVQSLGNREKRVVHLNGNNSNNDMGDRKIITKFITTRFGNVLGSNGSVIPRFKEQIEGGGPVTVTHPDIIRYFMTIPEACSLVLEAVTMGNGGEVFLFDMGEPVKIVDLARKMIRLAGFVPGSDIEIRFTGLRPGEKLFEELLNKSEEVIPTHHKKILIAKVAEYDFYSVNKSIDVLLDFAWQNNDEDVVRQMKRIIPEYISNNSIYQSFDEISQPGIVASN
jgi:FlaA1/EpsC-like NDP-sugar epimerase